MAGHQCPIIHRLNHNTHVDIKNDQLKAIKAALRLSRCLSHDLMFEVGFYFRSLTITKPIIKEAPIYLGHWCHVIRIIWWNNIFLLKKALLTKSSNESTQIRILLSCGVMQARNEPFVNRTIWLQSQPRLGVGASGGLHMCSFGASSKKWPTFVLYLKCSLLAPSLACKTLEC